MGRSLRLHFLVAFLLPSALFFVAAGVASYLVSRAALEDELGRGLSAIAAAAASELNADRVLSLEPGDDVSGTRTFHNLRRALDETRAATGVRRICVFDRDGRARLDSGGALPIGAAVPDLERDRFELARVLAGARASSQVLFRGGDGTWYKTGYAPLKRGDEIVGAVAVEGSFAFFRPLAALTRTYVALAAVALVVLAAISLLTSERVARPLRRLVASALRIGGGDLSTPVAPEGSTEIGTLARELEAMRQSLEARDRQLKMMLAGVAHEVRNPIGGIELFAGLTRDELSNEPNPAEAKSHVERILAEIAQLKRIVDEFLAFAREQPLARSPIDVQRWLADSLALVESDARAKNVTLALEAQRAELDGDEALLLSALGNVLKNAVQASPTGARVRIHARCEGNRCLVSVSDEGAGIAAEQRERVFEAFFTTKEKGTGLGLPLARKILRAHGGELSLESPARPTTFRLDLPCSQPTRPTA